MSDSFEGDNGIRQFQKVILVVEDDKHLNPFICKEIEERFGDKVRTIPFFDGRPAFDFLKENPDKVHLIISCILMPELDGIKLLRMCKELKPRLPFIIHTAMDYRDDFAAWASEAYIVKSADLTLLLKTIDDLLFDKKSGDKREPAKIIFDQKRENPSIKLAAPTARSYKKGLELHSSSQILYANIVFNNPFRILGLPVNATEREITKQENDLKIYFKMGKTPKVKVEFPCFPACNRTSESVEEAKKKIERSENRLLYSFFWYSNEGSVNQLALDVLSEGKTEKAMELWEKALSKYMIDSDMVEKSFQPTDGELVNAIIDNFLIPYLADNYEIDQILSESVSRHALRSALKVYATDIREENLSSDDDFYYVVSNGPIGTDDNDEEMELDVEIEKTSVDALIADLSSKNLALPVKDFSYAKNLMVLYLGLAFKENELNFRYFSNALHLAGRIFHSNDALSQYATSIVGSHYGHDNGNMIAKFYIDEILKCVKPLLDDNPYKGTLDEIAKSFCLFPDKFRKEAIAILTNKPIQDIKKKVKETANKREKNPLEANKYGEELYKNTYDTLLTLKDILLANSLQYQNISDAVADEIVACSFDFFMEHRDKESNIDPGDDALKLAKYADCIASATRIKDRINKNMPILEEWVKDKPSRERRKKADPHIDYIVKQLNGLPDPDKVSPNELSVADTFLGYCMVRLRALKNIISLNVENLPSIIILEQFENNENKWPENEEGDFIRKIEGGKYILQSTNKKNGHWSWGVNHLDFSKFYNFTFECSITKIKGTDNAGFGIVWSYQKKAENTGYFKFCISGNGYYCFKEYNQGWVGGFKWTASEHVVRGNETNILTVRKNGNLVNFYINDKLIIGERISGENMIGNGIGFDVAQDMTIGVNYLYFCDTYISDFRTIFDYNYYMNLSSAVASRTLDFCIAYANRTHDMEKPITLMNKIQHIDMAPELRKRFDNNENILKSNLRIKEANTPPIIKLFKKVSKWF